MHDKYTALLSLTPAGLAVVPAGESCISFNVRSNAVRELPAGRALHARGESECFYSIPTAPFETRFAVFDAIVCSKPNGTEFRPGMSLNLRFTYANSLGVQKLLLLSRQHNGRFPECITLEDLHAMLHDEIKRICTRAATEFSHSTALPYAHWWNEIKYNREYCDKIYKPLMQLFMSYGLLLDKDTFSINSLAQMPVT